MDPFVLHKIQQTLKSLIEGKVLGQNKDDDPDIILTFVAPDSDFVTELTGKPTINCYLIGLNEDLHRRRSEPMRSTINSSKTQATVFSEPRYVDMTYMITVWSKDKSGSAEIEHMLMGYLVSGLGYFDFLPTDLQIKQELDIHPNGVRLTLFGSEYSDKISGQVWQAMGATPKPCLMLSLSVPVSVIEPQNHPVVEDIKRTLNKLN